MSSDDFEYSSPLRDAAASMHELFVTLKEAGFSRRDALEIIVKIMTGAILDAVIAEDEEDEDE